MKYRLLLVMPRDISSNYAVFSRETEFITRMTGGSPPVSLATIAALTPPDFKVEIIDENIEEIKYNEHWDIIGITGNTYHLTRAREIARRFSKSGSLIVCGGYSVSLCPERWREFTDILIIGEAERIWPQFLSDYISGSYKNEYREKNEIDLSISPVPDYSGIKESNFRKYSYGVVQTSRGCPYRCEFCSVHVYSGSRIRHKPVENIIAEINQLKELGGYRIIFFADDNFSADIEKAKEILYAIREWNLKQKSPVAFITQLSIDAAKDEDFLELAANAGLTTFSVGIETPNIESLKEAHKYHNLLRNTYNTIHKIHTYGINVVSGSVVGFDNDEPQIFQQQLDFFSRLGIANVNVYPLLALDGAPLKERMIAEGRYIDWDSSLFTDQEHFNMLNACNIIPKKMKLEELQNGIIWLLQELYSPVNFIDRFSAFFKNYDNSDKKEEIKIFKPNIDLKILFILLRLLLFLLFKANRIERRTFNKMFKVVSKSTYPQRFGVMIFLYLRILNNKNFISYLVAGKEHESTHRTIQA